MTKCGVAEDRNRLLLEATHFGGWFNSTQLNRPRDLDGKTWPRREGKQARAYKYPLSL